MIFRRQNSYTHDPSKQRRIFFPQRRLNLSSSGVSLSYRSLSLTEVWLMIDLRGGGGNLLTVPFEQSLTHKLTRSPSLSPQRSVFATSISVLLQDSPFVRRLRRLLCSHTARRVRRLLRPQQTSDASRPQQRRSALDFDSDEKVGSISPLTDEFTSIPTSSKRLLRHHLRAGNLRSDDFVRVFFSQ